MELSNNATESLLKSYKQTDIGLLPKDWIEDTLGGIINLLTDFTANGSFASLAQNVKYLDKPDYARLVRLTDIRVDFKNEGIYITKDAFEFLSKSKLFGNELLLANVGAYTGYSFLYPKGLPFRGSLGPNMFLIKFDELKLDPKFAFYSFTNSTILNQLLSKSASSAQPKLNKQNVRECIICYPPTKAEQTAIANALSDADALISSLEKLIEKKRNIKQGAMQQLLKPKKGWVTKKLGEVADIYTGKKDNQNKVENGEYPFFVRSQNIERINSYSFDGEAILVPGEGNIGKIFHYINGKFDFHQRVYMISNFNENYSAKYVYCYMHEHFGKHAMTNSVKATVDSLRLPTFQVFEIPFPSTLAEQNEIATILSDMDNEIELLEKKLSKRKMLKQGMMQELLTGKIRLI